MITAAASNESLNWQNHCSLIYEQYLNQNINFKTLDLSLSLILDNE